MIMMKGLRYMNFEDLNTYHQLAFYRILNDISSGMALVDICSENDEILDLFYNEILKKVSFVKELKLDGFTYNNEDDIFKNKIKLKEYIKENYKRNFCLIVRDAEKFFQTAWGFLEENKKFSLEDFGFFHANLREMVQLKSIILLGKGKEWALGGVVRPDTRNCIHAYYLDDSEFLTRLCSLSENQMKERIKELSNYDYDEQRKTFIKRWYGEGKTL